MTRRPVPGSDTNAWGTIENAYEDVSHNADGSLKHSAVVTGLGTFPTYTVTNGTTDRTFNADSTSLDELADVLATLIADLNTLLS